MGTQRVDKIITSQGTMTRAEVKRLLKSGAVTVNGKTVKDPGLHVQPETDLIVINGTALRYRRFLYLMMNKPAGVLSASRDPKAETVIDLLPEELRRAGLFPAGRLDKDTTGFVLITDDGDFAHRMLSPARHVEKLYEAQLDHPVGEKEIAAFAAGITLEDGLVCMKARLEPLADNPFPAARVTVCEGKFHQVKRMFAAVDRTVIALRRLAIGGVRLDEGLSPGECRELTENELNSIFNK